MPSSKLNFSLSPTNNQPVNLTNGSLADGFSHKNGFPTVKFSIPAQNVLLDVSSLYLCGQFLVQDADGTNITTATADRDNYNADNSQTITKQNCINKSNWNGVASVIDKVVLQSKKSQTELQTIINYSGYNALKMGNSNNQEDYHRSAFIRNMCSGTDAGYTERHMNNTPTLAETRATSLTDRFIGQFFSIRLDIAMLNSQMIHLGNDFAGGLLLTLHLSPDSAVFHSRFRNIHADTTNGDIAGVSYILKNIKLEGKYAIPLAQDLKAYNPVITMNSRVNLMNDVVSSENSNTYTPQLAMVKGVVNTFLDDNQTNNYKLNQNNFRMPLGLTSYNQAKNNIQYPYQYSTQIKPNFLTSTPNMADFPQVAVGDSELRLQFMRSLLGGKMTNHTSATLALSNDCIQADYDAQNTPTGASMKGRNITPDLLGVGCDYSNGIGQQQNYVNQDYELKLSSGVGSGITNLPTTRNNRISIQETYVRNFSQINLKTLQKVQ